MRYIPLRLENLWKAWTDSFECIEHFLDNFKVLTLAQVNQEKFLPLTEPPHFCRFSKNLMRRRFYRATFFYGVIWSWLNVRYIPMRPENLREVWTDSFERIENFLRHFKVHTLTQVSQEKFLPLTELPYYCRFSKNLMGRRFYRAIFYLCVVWSWINVRYIHLRLENLWKTWNDSFECIENFLSHFKVHALAQVSQENFLPLTEFPHFCRFFKKSYHLGECVDFEVA